MIRLSPLHPGYVMTVCAFPPTSIHIAAIRNENLETMVLGHSNRVGSAHLRDSCKKYQTTPARVVYERERDFSGEILECVEYREQVAILVSWLSGPFCPMDCPPAGDGTLLLPFIQPPIVLLQAEAEALICGMAMHLGG